jgi:DNA-binding transcriptional ArsR family regulator
MSLQTLQKQATILKALSHPRRLEIIHLIRDQELPVQDIHQMLDLPQANVSQHLKRIYFRKLNTPAITQHIPTQSAA